MIKKLSFVASCLLLLFFASSARIAAQQNASVTVVPQQIDPQKLSNLQNTYFGQLELYRNQEEKYFVAVGQYHKLNTLASQEVAVAETRQLLALRADVLITYIDILDEQLSQARGIPLENKSPERIALTLLKEQVQTHKTAVMNAKDRFELDKVSTSFLVTFSSLQSHTYYILSLIKVGSMQIAYDKLLVTRNAVQEYVNTQPLSTAVKAEKDRGFAEISRNIVSIDTTFTPIKTQLYSSPGKRSLSDYTQLTGSLSPVYAQINQVIAFLEEIRK